MAPLNDNAGDAFDLGDASLGSGTGDCTDSTMQVGDPLVFEEDGITPRINNGVWFKWVCPSTGTYVFKAVGEHFVPFVSLFKGTVVETTWSLSLKAEGPVSIRYVFMEEGEDYLVRVAGDHLSEGPFSFEWRLYSVSTNPYFDGLDVPYQLGGDLQEHVSGDMTSAPADFESRGDALASSDWDFTRLGLWFGEQNPSWAQPTRNIVDMCMHRGELHVIWVELEDAGVVVEGDGAQQENKVKGPYVKKWDGESWVMVGSAPVDDDPTIGDALFHRDRYWDNTWLTEGHRAYPARPRIVSDGTDLFIAYSAHIAAPVADPPPTGSYTYDLPYGTKVSAGTRNATGLWRARGVVVRKQVDSDWQLIDVIPAATNNNHNVRGSGYSNMQFAGKLGLSASPWEPGAVYVSFCESGSLGSHDFYLLNPSFFMGFVFGTEYYPHYQAYMRMVRFDDSGFGVGINIVFADYKYVVGLYVSQVRVSAQSVEQAFASVEITNAGGTGYVLWVPTAGPYFAGTLTYLMQRWPDMSAVQSFNPGGYYGGGTYPWWFSVIGNISYSELRDQLYVQLYGNDDVTLAAMPMREIVEDASSSFDWLDSEKSALTEPNILPIFTHVVPEEPNNIWALQMGGGSAGTWIWLYHRTCKGWTRLRNTTPVDEPSYTFGEPAMVVDGDTVYIASAYYTLYSPDTQPPLSNDLRIRVHAYPIIRNMYGCGGPGAGEGLTLKTERSTMPFISGVPADPA